MGEQSIQEQANYGHRILGDTTKKFVFVTGGSGLVGSNLIAQLLAEGRMVKALYRTTIPDIPGKENVSWVQGDILDIISLEEAMTDVIEVYHCAAVVSFHANEKAEMFKTNIDGTANVVDTANAAGVQKLCFVSSVAALGKSLKNEEINETNNWSEETDNSNYGKSKYYAEMEVWRAIGEGLHAVIVNPSIIFGAGNWNDGSTKIFKTAYEEFKWYTEGGTGFVDVKDVVKAMTALMTTDIARGRFIISAENRTFKDIFTTIAKAFNKKQPYKKATPFLSQIVLKLETVKSMLSGVKPLLTKETAQAAQTILRFDNSKLLKALPGFTYTPLDTTIERVTKELTKKYKL
ncbi:MAG TPA: NAD-dependent epimerase/dehydratase family protein [Segetibacter sp.]